MTDYQRSLASFYKGLDVHQQRLVIAIAPLTTEQLALRASPHTWPIGRIVAHIVAARVWWLHTRAGEGHPDLAPLEHWDGACAPVRTVGELVHGLDLTW